MNSYGQNKVIQRERINKRVLLEMREIYVIYFLHDGEVILLQCFMKKLFFNFCLHAAKSFFQTNFVSIILMD